jgi:predicted MFS family arabinose efflux permease
MAPGPTVWQLLRTARLLQVMLLVGIAANLAFGGTFEVALPALAHARFGAGGYGALLACFGAGAVLGTLYAARAGTLARPAIAAIMAFLVMSVATGLVPFLGGLPGAAAAILVLGATNGFGNVVFLTLLQRWARGQLLGRVMSLVMLASLGSFPLSVAVSGLLVRHIGPSPFFPVAGALVAVSVAAALSQREVRRFGAGDSPAAAGAA